MIGKMLSVLNMTFSKQYVCQSSLQKWMNIPENSTLVFVHSHVIECIVVLLYSHSIAVLYDALLLAQAVTEGLIKHEN